MNNLELAEKLLNIAHNYKTLYVMGCFGSPLNSVNKTRYIDNEHYNYNNKPERAAMIRQATADTFGFDCVNLIKGAVWGWNGDSSKTYGGAVYMSNGCPDVGADSMIGLCNDVSTDWTNINIGEFVWMKGHCGLYVGDGLVVESSPKWENCVQITAISNIGGKLGYNARTWTKHGKLPFISYTIVKPHITAYNRFEDIPPYAIPTITKLVSKGALQGTTGKVDEYGNPVDLDLSPDMLRTFVILDRYGIL